MHFAILTTKSTIQCKVISNTVRKACANAYDGFFTQCKTETATDFLNALDDLKQNQSIILGTPHKPDGTALNVGEKIGLTTKEANTNAIPRSKDFIKNINREGFLLFDIDDGGTYDNLLALFPELDGVWAVVVPSSSSFIFNADGSVHTGAKGWHIYIRVLNMSDAARIADILWGKMWLQGSHGNIKISNGIHPAMLERGLWDKCVLAAPERLAFEAAPILNDGLTRDVSQHRRAIDGCAFDTEKVADLTAYEKKEIAELIKKAKAEKEPERKKSLIKAKKLYIEKSEKTGTPKAEAVRNWEMIGRKQLPYDFILNTANGEREAGSLNADDDGLLFADPNEPEYNGGSFCAAFYWNDGNQKIHSFAHGKQVYSIAPHPDDWKTALMLHVVLFNQTHAAVSIGGKHRIVREIAANETLEFFEQKELEKFYQNSEIKTGEKENARGEIKDIFTNKIRAWAEHPNCRVFLNGVIFEPAAQPKEGYYNTWRGFAVEQIKADEKTENELLLIKDHIEKIVCAGNPELIKYFFNWCAYTFQKPEKQAGAVVVLVGEKGTGKSILGHFLRNIWGAHGKHISSTRHLVGNFNAHLADVCFLFADEAFYAGDKAGENVLKSLVTEPMLAIERKGIDTTFQKNRLKIFMATNNEKAVPASRDERRYCVFNVSSSRRGDRAYFDALNAAINNPDVQAAFLYEMLALDLTGFHTGDIPDSDGLNEQRYQSLSSAARWLLDALSEGYFYNDEGNVGWTRHVNSQKLHKSYIDWCDKMKINPYDRFSQIALGRYLKKAGFKVNRTTVSRLFDMRELADAVAVFSDYEKVTV